MTPLVVPSRDASRALVLLAPTPIELHLERLAASGALVASWRGRRERVRAAVGSA